MNTIRSAPAGHRADQGDHAVGLFKVVFSHAFRPFFLGASVYAALAMTAWLAWIAIHAAGAMPAYMTVSEPLHLWHAHEMIYGFGAAAVGGFLLTAVPNWTGAPRSRGMPLALMFAIWIGGRIAMWTTALLPGALPMFLDMAFVPVLAFAAGGQLAIQPALRNVMFLGLLVALLIGNVLFHLGRLELLSDGMATGVRLGLGTLVVMVVIIGGRVIPAFTTNALRRQGVAENRLPASNLLVDRTSLVSAALAMVLLAVGAPAYAVGAAALVAAVANGARLSRWRSIATLRQPIVWVLHLGYAWIVVGFCLLAVDLLLQWGSEISALHAFGAGAVGTMILAISSRASLGHTGRGLAAPRPLVIAYILVSVSALLRCFGPDLAPQFYNAIMLCAGLVWIAAFLLFLVVFAPILLRPRVERTL